MPQTGQRIVAGGTILPFRFVMPDPSADHQGLQATANAEIIGVSGEGAKKPPLSDLVTGDNPHAEAGDPVFLYGDGEEAVVEAGAAITPQALLKADADGRAVPVASGSLQQYGARAQQAAAAAGELIRVSVHLGAHTTAP